MSEELRECPFCGGRAHVYPCTRGLEPGEAIVFTGEDSDWTVGCCDCNAHGATSFSKKEQAIAAWNTRSNPAASPGVVGALDDIYSRIDSWDCSTGSDYISKSGVKTIIHRALAHRSLGNTQAENVRLRELLRLMYSTCTPDTCDDGTARAALQTSGGNHD